MDAAYQALVRIFGVWLWGLAAFHKLREPKEFLRIFAAYEIPVPRLHGVLLALLVVAESTLALAFGVWPNIALPAWGSVILLCVYAGALVREIRAGRTDHACGCGAPARHGGSIGWGLVVRNAMLAVLFASATVTPLPREWTWLDTVTVLAGSAAAMLLYLAIDALASAPRARRPEHEGNFSRPD